MNRRERRISERRTRRIGAVVASMAILAASAGLGGVAFAVNGSGGCSDSGCGGGTLTPYNGNAGGGGEGGTLFGGGGGKNSQPHNDAIYCNGLPALDDGPPAHDVCGLG